MASPRELDVHDLHRPRTGEVDRWLRWAVAAGCLVTFIVALVVPRVIVSDGEGTLFDGFWFQNALAIEVGIVVAFGCIPLSRVSRSVRLAVLLPVLHVGLMGVVGVGWRLLESRLPGLAQAAPMLQAVPLPLTFVTVAAAIGVTGWLLGRHKRGETLHAIVMIALVNLLLLGIWLPIASMLIADPGVPTFGEPYGAYILRHEAVAALLPTQGVAMVMLPPLVASATYVWIAMRRRSWLPWIDMVATTVLFVAWAMSLQMRRAPTDLAAIVYNNFLPWILAAAVTTVGAISTLSVMTWLGARRRRSGAWHQYTGTIAGERGELIAGYEITSWLRGPRAIAVACEVVTARGTIPVPAGAHLHAPLPLATTLLRTGEHLGVLRAGDEVALGGYAQHATGQPFRDSGAPIPGDDGVAIGPTTSDAASQLALVAWRPCIAYLVITVIVAIPALITAMHPM